MNKEEVQLLGFEIVAYAGDARAKLLTLMSEVSEGDFSNVDATIEEAESLINHAHKLQMDLIASEAQGTDIAYSFTMVHAQDHLMTVITMKELVLHMVKLYIKTGEK